MLARITPVIATASPPSSPTSELTVPAIPAWSAPIVAAAVPARSPCRVSASADALGLTRPLANSAHHSAPNRATTPPAPVSATGTIAAENSAVAGTPSRSRRAGPIRRTAAALTWVPATSAIPHSAKTSENCWPVSPYCSRSTNGEPGDVADDHREHETRHHRERPEPPVAEHLEVPARERAGALASAPLGRERLGQPQGGDHQDHRRHGGEHPEHRAPTPAVGDHGCPTVGANSGAAPMTSMSRDIIRAASAPDEPVTDHGDRHHRRGRGREPLHHPQAREHADGRRDHAGQRTAACASPRRPARAAPPHPVRQRAHHELAGRAAEHHAGDGELRPRRAGAQVPRDLGQRRAGTCRWRPPAAASATRGA